MSTVSQVPLSKEEILRSFDQLVRAVDARSHQIVTRAEEAERLKDRTIVEAAATYSVESIVKGMADLQLRFASAVAGLTDELQQEAAHLEELERAIAVEGARLTELRNLRCAAEALNILERQIADRNAATDKSEAEVRQSLQREIDEARKLWAREQTTHEQAVAAFDANLARERGREQETWTWETDRRRKVDLDALTEKRRLLDRRLTETEERRNADWAERQAVLDRNASHIAELRTRVAAFDDEQREAVNKAREEAIRRTTREAEIEAELKDKEIHANVQVFELKIQTLEAEVDKNNRQIEKLVEQLQVALSQSQQLAVKAIEGSSHR